MRQKVRVGVTGKSLITSPPGQPRLWKYTLRVRGDTQRNALRTSFAKRTPPANILHLQTERYANVETTPLEKDVDVIFTNDALEFVPMVNVLASTHEFYEVEIELTEVLS